MSSMRKWLCLFSGLVLVTLAVSANAAKTITLTNVPAALDTSTTQVQITLNNTGNSNASAAELDWTATPQFTVTSGTITGSKGLVAGVLISPGQTPGGYNGIQFTFTLPQKTSAVITLNVTVNAGAVCGAPQLTWQPYAWTGGVGQPSTSFTAPPTGTYTSNLPGASGCTLSFVGTRQPADAFVGSACAPLTCLITSKPFNSAGDPVQVQAMHNGSPVSGVSVTIGNIGACSIVSSATTDNTGTASLTSISSTSAGIDCQLTATAAGFASATSGMFDVDQQAGTLSCAPTAGHKGNLDPNAVPPIAAGADWGLERGLNRDGTCGPDVPFTFEVDGNTNTAIFIEDSLGQPTSVEYVIRWAPVDVDADKWSAFQPCVSYGIADPGPVTRDGNGVCIGNWSPALACIADDVNAPGDGKVSMPTNPNAYPFNPGTSTDPIVLATGTNYPVGNTAKVCVSQQGWTSNNIVKNGQIQYWHKFIDQTDTRIVGP